MNNFFLFFHTCFLFCFFTTAYIQAQRTMSESDIEDAIAYCTQKTEITLKAIEGYHQFPRFIRGGEYSWELFEGTGWTNGFWPGILWYISEYGKRPDLQSAAEKFTTSLEPILDRPVKSHDLGFLFQNSYGHAYRITGEKKYKEKLLLAADSLTRLFNPHAGTILSWPTKVRDKTFAPHNTIIDGMMNLELLFEATRLTGDSSYYFMARQHASTTMKNHIRADSTTWHVLVYDDKTGKVLDRKTHQGYADNSLWARGQAWAIYGFTMCYRETGCIDFLHTAQAVAWAYLQHLPGDLIPYWDFCDPAIPYAPRDASAAAIAASALIELSEQTANEVLKQVLRDAAMKMLKNLSSGKYQSRNNNAAFLSHSTGSKPGNYEVDVPIIYADYYYLEALLRANRLLHQKKY